MKIKTRKSKVNIEPLKSLKASQDINDICEKRIFTLFLKGLIVYCVSAGLIGGALSATKSSFSDVVFNVVIFVLSMVVSAIYYNKTTENIGDILYLIMLVICGIMFASYINSGFYSWMNDVLGIASEYFDIPEIGGYATRIKNVSLALTIAACYLGAVCVIIINMSVVKKMHFLDLALDAVLLLFLPAYLELESNFYYSSIVILGLLMSVCWNLGGKYKKFDSNSVYTQENNEITYTLDYKAHLFVFVRICFIAAIILIAFYVVFPKDDYTIVRRTSDAKEKSDDLVERLITSGVYGFFNRYDSVGGMSSGRLGGVNSVRLDYETDLEINYVPYSNEPVYLRTFIGGEYVPYSNIWNAAYATYLYQNEFEMMQKRYNDKTDMYGKGIIRIENIEAETACYQPYYSEKYDKLRAGETTDVFFYPRLMGQQPFEIEQKLTKEDRTYWTYVPIDNKPSVINFIDKLNIDENMDEFQIAECLKQYYLINYPYTLRPGSTPWRKDFINYFLDTKKKGYCAHFASAATLVFRQLGIPARYVEGYVFDYTDLANAKVNNDINIDDFYDGYSPIDGKIGVTVELSDANAHAWVEIFTESYGWIPVELTPPSSDIEMSESSFWENFMRILNPSNDATEGDDDNSDDLTFDGKKIRATIIVLFFAGCVALIILFIRKVVIYMYKYLSADINTRLIMVYRNFIHRNIKRYDKLADNPNYREEINYIFCETVADNEREKCISILEKAGFSNSLISLDDFKYVSAFLKKKKRGVKR